MLQVTQASSPVAEESVERRSLLRKPDHPRDIDRYIDYFGDSSVGARDGSFHMTRLRDLAETQSGD